MYDVTIVGAGITGLTAALALQSAGLTTRILAAAFSPHTTSDRAGAVWLPLAAEPSERMFELAERSLAVYAMQIGQEGSPVHQAALTVALGAGPVPAWLESLDPARLRRALPEELPEGAADGYVVLVPVIEAGRYLQSLMEAYRSLGGVTEEGVVETLGQVEGRIVVNCAGLGAGALTGDKALSPLSRHGLRAVVPHPVRTVACRDVQGGMTLVVNLPDGCFVGGEDAPGQTFDDPDESVLGALAMASMVLEPGLAGAEIVDAYVAACPARPEVRLEEDRLEDGRRLIHNYGHGAAGWTLAWGCAEEVVRLVVQPEE